MIQLVHAGLHSLELPAGSDTGTANRGRFLATAAATSTAEQLILPAADIPQGGALVAFTVASDTSIRFGDTGIGAALPEDWMMFFAFTYVIRIKQATYFRAYSVAIGAVRWYRIGGF